MIKLMPLIESETKPLLPFGEQEWNRVNNISKGCKNDNTLNAILATVKKQGYKASERQRNYIKMWLQSGKDGIQWGRKN